MRLGVPNSLWRLFKLQTKIEKAHPLLKIHPRAEPIKYVLLEFKMLIVLQLRMAFYI